tara:strand:- start:197153 stop:198307 length:1155 start_codon:yes stop_codon:yes gene_type:complete
MILRKYLYKEILQTFFATVLVLMLIAVSNKFVSLISKAAIGEFPPGVLLHMIWFIVPEILAIILPISYFLAILLSFGKLFVDLEIPVMLACGLSWRFLTSTAVILAVPITILSFVLTLYLSPQCYQHRDMLLKSEDPVMLAQAVVPGRFHSLQHDKWILYAGSLNPEETELQDIFIAEQPVSIAAGSPGNVLTAKSGKIVKDQNTGNTYVYLSEGKRYQGRPGGQDYSVIMFDDYQRLVEQVVPKSGVYHHKGMPTKMLFENLMPSNMAELQWRFSVPLATLLLGFFAVPISRLNPRKGRFSKIFVGVVVAIVYFNLLTLCKRWIEAQILPGYIGMWWVHFSLFALASISLMHVSGRFHKLRQPWQRFIKRFQRLTKLRTKHQI